MRIEGAYPSPEELSIAAEILGRLPPGRLPLAIFNQTSRLTVLPVVEVVPLYRSPRGLDVLLLQRSKDDPWWPSMWHSPGSVILSTDRAGPSYKDAIRRVIEGELQNPQILSGPTYFGHGINKEERGLASWTGFWIEIDQANAGRFFDVNRLPENLIKVHEELIAAAVKSFRQHLVES